MPTGMSSSMLKKLTGFLVRRKSGEITPAEAEKIQKASYALAHAEIKKNFSPVWQSVISGLESEEKQIFEATAFYLARIAKAKEKYKEEILLTLNEKIKERGINPEFREYLKKVVQDIE